MPAKPLGNGAAVGVSSITWTMFLWGLLQSGRNSRLLPGNYCEAGIGSLIPPSSQFFDFCRVSGRLCEDCGVPQFEPGRVQILISIWIGMLLVNVSDRPRRIETSNSATVGFSA